MLPAGVLMLVVNEVIQTVFVAHEGCLSTLESRLKREGGREMGETTSEERGMLKCLARRETLAQIDGDVNVNVCT